jgi:hypothetical protein
LKPTSSPIMPLAEMYIVPITNMALNLGFTKHYYMNVTSGQAILCLTNGPNGDADLYLCLGELAVPDLTSTKNACSSYSETLNELCSNITVIAITKLYAAVHAFTLFSSLIFIVYLSHKCLLLY